MESQEKDHLQYRGNDVPRILRFAWTLFFIGAAIYLARHFWPDLMMWMQK